MAFIDFLLNAAALLLWLNWRSRRVAVAPRPGAMAAVLQPTEKPRSSPRPLVWLAALLVGRSLVYWQIGGPLRWAPALDFGVVSPPFRSDFLGLMGLYSIGSFLRLVILFYLWLVLLSLVNRRTAEPEPLHRWVRAHLGRWERLPAMLRGVLPFVGIGLLWIGVHPLLVRLNLLPTPASGRQLVQEAVLIGTAALLAWKPLLLGVLLLHALGSYVYFGSHPFWNYVAITGRNLLRPLKWLPLRLGRVDFAPFVAFGLVLAGAHYLARGLATLHGRLPL
jgi:uncharacterized protein YggT (Ycf19 family)